MNKRNILRRYKRKLKQMIKQQNDPLMIAYFANNYGKKNFEQDDMIELKGYFNGLKVAYDMLEYLETESKDGSRI